MRARLLKPAFFRDEKLAELPFEWRLLRVGLDLLADRKGRLVDVPKQIRRELFPFDDNIDVHAGLTALAYAGYIVRYATEDELYVQIVGFDQTPNKRERASAIPGPNAAGSIVMQSRAEDHTAISPASHEHVAQPEPKPPSPLSAFLSSPDAQCFGRKEA